MLPKGLLPVVDTPAIQLVVEEALAAGCEDVILVIGPGQDDLLRHFAPAPELEAELTARGKTRELELVRRATVDGIRFGGPDGGARAGPRGRAGGAARR